MIHIYLLFSAKCNLMHTVYNTFLIKTSLHTTIYSRIIVNDIVIVNELKRFSFSLRNARKQTEENK